MGRAIVPTLVEFALAPHVLPASIRADAERLLADTLAVGAAGAFSPQAPKVFGAWGVSGDQSRLLSGGTATAADAAFFNGFAIHCLEWDAVHEPAVVHAMSVVTAALLTASDRRGGSDPDAFLTALAVGVDVASGLGLSATGPMTFFRPATAGVLGAALAVARLENLSPAQATNALGLAYSFASGTMQAHVEASLALPLQIGNAARAAVNAVDLAKAGLDGPHDVIDGPFGYARLIEPLDLTAYLADLGHVWRISDVSIKPFPSGRASHAVLSVVSLVAEPGQKITAHVPPLVHRLVGRPMKPDMTAGYARLCLPFLTALMVRDKRIDPRCFTAATFADPEIQATAALVEVIVDDNADTNALSPQALEVDGQRTDIRHTLGSPDAPMTPHQSASKYALCRELAPGADPRLFDHPLGYAAQPSPVTPGSTRGPASSAASEAGPRIKSGVTEKFSR